MKILYRKNEEWDLIVFKYPTLNISKGIISKKLSEKHENATLDIIDVKTEQKCELYSIVTVYYAILS